MATITVQPAVPPIIGRKLRLARRQIRAIVWLEGLAALATLLGAAFWLGLWLDRWLEPPPAVRFVALLLVAVASVWVIDRQLLRLAFAPLADASLAALFERRFHRLEDHVLTAVDLADRDAAKAYHPELVSRTHRAAAQAMANVRTWEMFQQGPLVRAVALAVLFIASIPIFAVAANETFQFWLQRVALSSEPWPRQVHLEVVGFPADRQGRRAQKIAQDDSFELLVHADATNHVIPKEVELRFSLADGRRGRDTMIRVGEAVPGRDDVQLFRYEFKHVAADMTLDVVGGDDRVRDLHLQIVDRPELVEMEVECVYPDYLGWPDRRLPITGGMRIPEGTNLTLHTTATKPLDEVRVRTSHDSHDVTLAAAEQPDGRITWDYGTLSADDVLTIQITDQDGITCREPYRVSLSMIPDELPQIAVRLAGIGTAITPNAVLPLTGKISDDYLLKRVWFVFQIDAGPAAERPFQQQPAGQQSLTELDRFDTHDVEMQTGDRTLQLEPGQTLSLSVQASDWYDLDDSGRAGSSQQFVLDVVTEAQLLAMMERRELELRQRFEAIYAKVTDTRNLLGRVDFSDQTADSADDAMNDDRADEAAESAADAPAAAARALTRRRLRVAGSSQNITQAAHEIMGVAEAFDDIHDQLDNNRVDNVDLKSRLREQIAAPLRHLGENRMTALESQLQLVQENIADAELGAPALADGIRLADEILVEMQQVLERMLELETYNEVVALLRGIIQDQRSLNDRTKQRRTDRLRSLQDE
jgi:hypothetical protein